jgi:hypothetical protein
MKRLLTSCIGLSAFTSLMLNSAQAEFREFTSTDGRKMQAEVEAVTPDRVTIKTAAGASYVTPISQFSAADQAYFKEWAATHTQSEIRYRFEVSYTKEKLDTRNSRDGHKEIKNENWRCNLKIINNSGQTLDQLKVIYTVIYDKIQSDRAITVGREGSKTIDLIKHHEQLIIPTDEVTLTSSQLVDGWYYFNGSRVRKKDSIEGVKVSLEHKGKEVFTWKSMGSPETYAAAKVKKDNGKKKKGKK